MAAAQSQALIGHCLALERQCNVGVQSLGLAHRIVGIVALSVYLIPHMSYVRKGQLDLKHMPYSAYRWVGRGGTCQLHIRADAPGAMGVGLVAANLSRMLLLEGMCAVAAAASTAIPCRLDTHMQFVARCALAVDGLRSIQQATQGPNACNMTPLDCCAEW